MLKTGQRIEVTGTVRLVGSEPWTEIVITDESGTDWYIERVSAEKFRALLQETVTVTGTLKLTAEVLANNKKIGSRRELTKIEINPAE